MATTSELEALLYFEGGAVKIKELASMLQVTSEDVEALAVMLEKELNGRGVSLIRESESLALATSPQLSSLIERVRRDELEGPLGKAGLETLAIIIYRGPLGRGDIEYVRGVNSTAILRSLMIRGLIERVDNPTDKRSFHYRATPELPAYLGVSSLTELPGYTEVVEGLTKIFNERDTEKTENEPT